MYGDFLIEYDMKYICKYVLLVYNPLKIRIVVFSSP